MSDKYFEDAAFTQVLETVGKALDRRPLTDAEFDALGCGDIRELYALLKLRSDGGVPKPPQPQIAEQRRSGSCPDYDSPEDKVYSEECDFGVYSESDAEPSFEAELEALLERHGQNAVVVRISA